MQNYMGYNPNFYQNMYSQSPYQDKMNQLQAVQQSLQQPQISFLHGRIVDQSEGIMASDVPMDGSFAVFPKRDMSEMYLKYWTGDGKIATVVFKPILTREDNSLPLDQTTDRFDEINEVLKGLCEKVEDIYSRIDEMSKAKSVQKGKKEVSIDE